jgi:hypothetical protein
MFSFNSLMIGLKDRALALLLYLMLLAAVGVEDPVHSAFLRLICVNILVALYLLVISVLAISSLLAFKVLHYLSDLLKLAHFIDLSLNYKAFLYRLMLHILSGKAYYKGSPLFIYINLALMLI